MTVMRGQLVTAAVEDPWIRWEWVSDHRDDITARLVEHIELVGIALVVGLAIAVPLGVAVWRWKRLYPPVLAVMGVIYSIPSLALLAFLSRRSTTCASAGRRPAPAPSPAGRGLG